MGHAHEVSPPKLINIVDYLKNPNHIIRRLYVNNNAFQFDVHQFKGMSKNVASNLKKALKNVTKREEFKLVMKYSKHNPRGNQLCKMSFGYEGNMLQKP